MADVARAVAHYERLGFTTSHHDETYAFAHRDNVTIHLAQREGEPTTGALYLHVDDADDLADAWRVAGVELVAPQDFGYGKREGSRTDPDGNLIRFGSPSRKEVVGDAVTHDDEPALAVPVVSIAAIYTWNRLDVISGREAGEWTVQRARSSVGGFP